MKTPDRQRHRLAQYILRQLERRHQTEPERLSSSLEDLQGLLTQLQTTARRLDSCRSKGWQTAAQVQRDAAAQWVSELVGRAAELQTFAAKPAVSEVPSLRDVLGELTQLEAEFDKVDIDHRNHVIRVTIEPVTLKDVYLGPFRIELELHTLARRIRSYKVLADDPHPASSNENTTHPHVRDQELCEGDAAAGIRSALAAGRLCDFFTLVRSVLQTYNPGSPYVSLDSWDGVICHDCGYVTGDDDRSYCDGCDCDFCGDCMSYCRCCDDSRCQNCLEDCSECGEPACSKCRSLCKCCRKITCTGCLENDLCPACREEDEEPDGKLEESVVAADIGDPVIKHVFPVRQRRRNRHRRLAA